MAKLIQLMCAGLLFQFGCECASAQVVPLACQVIEAGGLDWEAGRWKLTRFNQGKFILVLDGKTIRSDSAAKALVGDKAICKLEFGDYVSCNDGAGGFLYFNPRARRGTVAQLIGGASEPADRRDSLSVAAFECQAF